MRPPIGREIGICVVGVGAKTPVGLTAPAAAAAVRAGISGFTEHPYMMDQQGEPMIIARVPNVSFEQTDIARFLSFSVEPALEALQPLASFRREVTPIPLYLGLPPRRPGRPQDLETQLSSAFRDRVGVGSVECIATGHAAGLMASEVALRRIAEGSSEFCLVGGIDSYLALETLEWIEQNGQLHGGANAYGIIPGEAAGFFLLCSEKTAERRRLSVLARVMAAATSREINLIKTDSICIGKGLTEVFQKVFAQLPPTADKIDHTVCDMNGEAYRADEHGFTIARLSNRFANAADFVTPADSWGDVGAASGPLFVNVAVAAARRARATARHSLLWTSSESGERSAVILGQPTLTKN